MWQLFLCVGFHQQGNFWVFFSEPTEQMRLVEKLLTGQALPNKLLLQGHSTSSQSGWCWACSPIPNAAASTVRLPVRVSNLGGRASVAKLGDFCDGVFVAPGGGGGESAALFSVAF